MQKHKTIVTQILQSETEKEPVHSDTITPALKKTEQPISETSNQVEFTAVEPSTSESSLHEPTQLDETQVVHVPSDAVYIIIIYLYAQNDEPSLVDDSSSDTSLYDAEVVCGTSEEQEKTLKERGVETLAKRVLPQKV